MLPDSLNIIISSDVSNDVYESGVNYDSTQILLLPRRYFYTILLYLFLFSDSHRHTFILIMRILIKILIHFPAPGYILHTVSLSGIQSFPDNTRIFYIVTLYFYPN